MHTPFNDRHPNCAVGVSVEVIQACANTLIILVPGPLYTTLAPTAHLAWWYVIYKLLAH